MGIIMKMQMDSKSSSQPVQKLEEMRSPGMKRAVPWLWSGVASGLAALSLIWWLEIPSNPSIVLRALAIAFLLPAFVSLVYLYVILICYLRWRSLYFLLLLVLPRIAVLVISIAPVVFLTYMTFGPWRSKSK